MKANLIKSTLATLGLAAALIITPSQIAQAAEFTVTDMSAVLWTNDSTALCSDADITTVVVPVVEAELPVAVTGVTSNGYFRIDIGGTTWYVQGIGLSASSEVASATQTAASTTIDTNVSASCWTQESVYNALMYLKATKYPHGTSWGYDKYDTIDLRSGSWTGTHRDYGGGAFAWRVMKDIFGEDVVLTSSYTENINDIKIGDVIFYDANYWIVTAIDGTYVTGVTGNVMINGASGVVYWDYKIAINDLFYSEVEIEDEYGNVIDTYIDFCGFTYYTAY